MDNTDRGSTKESDCTSTTASTKRDVESRRGGNPDGTEAATREREFRECSVLI